MSCRISNNTYTPKSTSTTTRVEGRVDGCKVCFDAGKSKDVYSSHRVKDKSGKTTCPLLLALNCRNCGKGGHTIKYCASVSTDTVNAATDAATNAATNAVANVSKKTRVDGKGNDAVNKISASSSSSYNPFSILDSVDDMGYTVKNKKSKKNKVFDESCFPSIVNPSIVFTPNVSKKSYANIVSVMPLPNPHTSSTHVLQSSKKIKNKEKNYEVSTTIQLQPFTPGPFCSPKNTKLDKFNNDCFYGRNGLSWADAVDDEEDMPNEDKDYRVDDKSKLKDFPCYASKVRVADHPANSSCWIYRSSHNTSDSGSDESDSDN